jgi:glycosyltransferase involved in cell wall biosynthesis
MTRASASPPTVSVVVPTFNRPALTERAVRSALAQTVAAREIVIVDDGSQQPFVWPAEGTPVEIRVLRLATNGGAAAARQAGVDAARGALIAFLDSDDVWAPHKLKTQMALLAERQDALRDSLTAVVCGWTAVPESGGQPRHRIPIASISARDFASGCWFSPGTTALVPRAAFETVGPLDGSLRRLEDLDWFLRLGLAGGRIVVAPILGATISIGRRGRLSDIDAAARIILDKLDVVADPAEARALRRRLVAYLDLERANAAYAEGRLTATAGYFMRSQARQPRLGIPLRRWWQPAPADGTDTGRER